MASQTEIRLRLLERRVEQLATMLLGTTSVALDVNWPEYVAQVDLGEPPVRPEADPKYDAPVPVVDPPVDVGPVDPPVKDPPVDPPVVDPPVDPTPTTTKGA